jgi:hypothetical protein
MRLSQWKAEVLAAIDRAAKGEGFGDLRFEVENLGRKKHRKPRRLKREKPA